MILKATSNFLLFCDFKQKYNKRYHIECRPGKKENIKEKKAPIQEGLTIYFRKGEKKAAAATRTTKHKIEERNISEKYWNTIPSQKAKYVYI